MKPIYVLLFSAFVLLSRCPAQSPSPATEETAKQSSKTAPEAGAEERAGLDAIVQARAELKAAEATHPGNTSDICNALEKLVGLQLDGHMVTDETLALVKRELVAATAGPGKHSPEYAAATGEMAEVLVAFDRPGEGRPYAQTSLDLSAQIFANSSDYADAADTLGAVCLALGDYDCALRTYRLSVEINRKVHDDDPFELVGSLNNLATALDRVGDQAAAIAALEEAVSIAYAKAPNDRHMLIIENNIGGSYSQNGQFDQAIAHLNKSMDLAVKLYGEDSAMALNTKGNLGAMYSRWGKFDLSWKLYEEVLPHMKPYGYEASQEHFTYARSLASGGRLTEAVQQGLTASRIGRENFVLGARTLPERQALSFEKVRPRGLDVVISVLAKHPEKIAPDVYQEVIRSRALVADEMARRQKNVNRLNDPELARLLQELDEARSALLTLEQKPEKSANADTIAQATDKMERAEAAVALRSAAFRDDERGSSMIIDDVRHNMPKGSVLISYVHFQRSSVEKVDPKSSKVDSYAAIVFHPDTGNLRIFDLGEGAEIDAWVDSARKTVDIETQSGVLGGKRNERAYREATGALRSRVWDPLLPEFEGAKLLLVVPDGKLNLIPFAAFPEGDGYWIDHGAVIHILSSERDLIPAEGTAQKSGLVAVGNPEFNRAPDRVTARVTDTQEAQQAALEPSKTRSADISCDAFNEVRFHPLPQSAMEVRDIAAQWLAANASGTTEELLGADATRESFLREAVRGRVLHVATHAFLLSKSCGAGNPLLQSGLVFAGANSGRENSILSAQQIASMDLSGVNWAVLSACNTGAGEVHDGEGVLGLQRAFRVAGARSVIMTLWPVDDDMSRRYMHELYAQRFGHGASTADSIWNASQKLLADRRAAGLSTHPWYWAGFVGSGAWE